MIVAARSGVFAKIKKAAVVTGPWTPLRLGTKLRAWYYTRDATGKQVDLAQVVYSGNTVSQWSDASGNAKHFIGSNQPQVFSSGTHIGASGTLPTINQNSNGYFSRAETTIPVEIFSVLWNNGSGYRDITGARRPGASGGDRLYFQPATGSNTSGISFYDDNGNSYSATLADYIQGTPTGGMPGELLDCQINSTALSISRFANKTSTTGSGIQSTASGAGYTGPLTCTNIALMSGYYNGGITDQFIGEISEHIEIGTALTSDERDSLRGYLAWNNGLQTSSGGVLPSNHPYYSSPPGLVLWDPSFLGSAFAAGFRSLNTSGVATTSEFTQVATNKVSLWKDWSGNGRHVAQTNSNYGNYYQPTYSTTALGSYPGLIFDNNNGNNGLYLSTGLGIPASTLINVFNVSICTTVNNGRVVSLCHAGDTTDYFNTGGYIPNSYASTTSFQSIVNASTVGVTTISNAPHVLGTVVTSTSLQTWVDGVAGTSSTITYPTGAWDAMGVVQTAAATTGQGMSGSVSEIVVITGLLTTSVINKVVGYLSWKYGLQANLPANHPYKSRAPYVSDP